MSDRIFGMFWSSIGMEHKDDSSTVPPNPQRCPPSGGPAYLAPVLLPDVEAPEIPEHHVLWERRGGTWARAAAAATVRNLGDGDRKGRGRVPADPYSQEGGGGSGNPPPSHCLIP